MIERDDPILALLPDDDDLPFSFRRLAPEEQAWRGRLFLMTWVISGHEAFSWSTALGDFEPHNTESRALVASVSDERLIEELRAHPLREEG